MASTAPQSVEELRKTLAKPEYANIPAIKNSRVYSLIGGDSGKDYFYTIAAISETLYRLYPDQYTAQIMEQDIRAHLARFFPAVSYAEYQQIRDRVNISE
jgi:hypothetical protein